MYRKLLIAHGGSRGGSKALDMALQLAECFRAELDLLVQRPASRSLTRLEGGTVKIETSKPVLETLAEARKEAFALGVPIRSHVIMGHEISDIADFMDRRGYDLLVIGYAGPGRLYDQIRGNSVNHLIELSPCPVLVIK
jgi:nucleotide-binding universal stress UspA family protein